MMWDSAISAAKWIVDALLKKHSDDKTIKRQKWLQVADYLETIATLIEQSISMFEKDRLPYSEFSQLSDISRDLGEVLAQIYGQDDRIKQYAGDLDLSLNIILLEDVARLGGDDPIDRSTHIAEFAQSKDLQVIVGRFRALALTLKATA